MFGSSKKAATGIHIGVDGLRVVELEVVGQNVELQGLIHLELKGAFHPGLIDSPEGQAEVIQALIQLREERGLRFRNAVVALSPSSYQLKQRVLPEAGDPDVRSYLEWEAGQILADEPKAYGIDYVESSATGFIVAAHQQAIRFYQEVFETARISIDLDIEPFALFNVLEFTEAVRDEGVELLVDVASDRYWTVLARNGEIDAAALGSWNGRAAAGPELLAEVSARLSGLLEGIEERPDRVWISGSDSRDVTWRVQLPDQLRVSGALVDPFRGVDISQLNQDDTTQLASRSSFVVPAGLAYRGLLT